MIYNRITRREVKCLDLYNHGFNNIYEFYYNKLPAYVTSSKACCYTIRSGLNSLLRPLLNISSDFSEWKPEDVLDIYTSNNTRLHGAIKIALRYYDEYMNDTDNHIPALDKILRIVKPFPTSSEVWFDLIVREEVNSILNDMGIFGSDRFIL